MTTEQPQIHSSFPFQTLENFTYTKKKRAVMDNQPVLWRDSSSTPITTGHYIAYLRIKLVSPCIAINSKTIHNDNTEEAMLRCTEMYHHLVLDELEKMCPIEDQPEVHLKLYGKDLTGRQKRFISILVGVLIISMVTVTAVAVAGVTQAAINSGKIADIQSEVERQNHNSETLQKNIDLVALTVHNLQTDFNKLLDKLQRTSEDFKELKNKQINTVFLISFLTSRFLNGNFIIKEAKRQWDQGKVDEHLLDYLNVTLPCGSNCPLKYANSKRCSLSKDREMFYMDFNVPTINTDLVLAQADPFRFMMKTKESNRTCSIQYSGPTDMIINKKQNCAVATNVRSPSRYDMLLSPGHTCLDRPVISRQKYFTVQKCDPSYPEDSKNFIQIKPFGNNVFIYCAGNTLEVSGKRQDCKDDVIQLPITTSFKINDINYTGSQLYVDHIERIDPDVNAIIN